MKFEGLIRLPFTWILECVVIQVVIRLPKRPENEKLSREPSSSNSHACARARWRGCSTCF